MVSYTYARDELISRANGIAQNIVLFPNSTHGEFTLRFLGFLSNEHLEKMNECISKKVENMNLGKSKELFQPVKLDFAIKKGDCWFSVNSDEMKIFPWSKIENISFNYLTTKVVGESLDYITVYLHLKK